jgi:serine protease Do
MSNTIKTTLIGLAAGAAGAFIFLQIQLEPLKEELRAVQAHNKETIGSFTNYEPASPRETHVVVGEDFTEASEKSTQSVVYIKTVSERYGRSSWLEMWLGGSSSMQQVGSGSGVIYKENGFIITNNHVIDGADKIQVIHDKKEYNATLVGRDPSTDLAILKIEAQDLPAISIGSSKDLKVGAWVLAVGNPFNLNSTVTAGIVSAKGRELNIVKSAFPIESFIQTDAAINPGNSGGALVNTKGELVGINTAILSQTGSYAGYGFAVPVDIAKKIADDLITFGAVQKAFIGADVVTLTPEIGSKLDTKNLDGVVISYIQDAGSAEKKDLQKGDIIREINGEKVTTHAEFEELLSYRSPGDKLYLTIEREGKTLEKELILTNKEGTTELLKRDAFYSKPLGVEFEAVSKVEQQLLDISSGVKVVDVKDGFFRRLNIDEGFIITAINNAPVSNPKELANILEEIKGKVVVQGVNKRGVKGYYTFYF